MPTGRTHSPDVADRSRVARASSAVRSWPRLLRRVAVAVGRSYRRNLTEVALACPLNECFRLQVLPPISERRRDKRVWLVEAAFRGGHCAQVASRGWVRR
jgi:hypothetical protein